MHHAECRSQTKINVPKACKTILAANLHGHNHWRQTKHNNNKLRDRCDMPWSRSTMVKANFSIVAKFVGLSTNWDCKSTTNLSWIRVRDDVDEMAALVPDATGPTAKVSLSQHVFEPLQVNWKREWQSPSIQTLTRNIQCLQNTNRQKQFKPLQITVKQQSKTNVNFENAKITKKKNKKQKSNTNNNSSH